MFSRLGELQAWEDKCDRVYFGHEFCQRLIPSGESIRQAIDHCAEKGWQFSLITPFVTSAGIAVVQERIAALLEHAPDGLEIVVNDFGVLNWLHREHPSVTIALGRLLTKQKRGPRIMRIADRLPRNARAHFQRSNIDAAHLTAFLTEMGVQRIELDNILQGIQRDSGMQASLYYPYAYVSTTRLCLLMNGEHPNKNLRSIGTCHRECRRYDVTLTHADMPVPLKLHGNTQFFRNDKLPKDLAALNITRLVYEPHLP
ncbi:MAG: hypothetical protein HN341_10215 [Verrucomicrobia bacterium]|nr:hypothetical protein [Verrucomicrobiota bacterium]